MITKIKKQWLMILMIVIILVAGVLFYNAFYNINTIAKGEFVEEIISPNGEYTLKSYLIKGDSLSGDAMKVVMINNNTKKEKNIYFNYPEKSVKMKWVDKKTVDINGIRLNVFKETYDWRKNR